MNGVLVGISLLVLTMPVFAGVRQVEANTPAQQYAALLEEYQPASVALRMAKTDLQRNQAVQRLSTFPTRFLALAEKHPTDPIVIQVLTQAIQVINSRDSAAQIVWETNRSDFPSVISDGSANKVVQLLMRDHVLSDKLVPVCDRIRWGYRLEYEKFLRAVLDVNPHRKVQAKACLSLAQFLNDRSRMSRLAEYRPELIKRYGILFGKNYLEEIRQLRLVERNKRIEALFEKALQYDDVNDTVGGTIAEKAKIELHNIRRLTVGRLAMDIEGKDQDGIPFKLSDYRGKVVLLYFWLEF